MRYHMGDGQLNDGSAVHVERCRIMEGKGCSDMREKGQSSIEENTCGDMEDEQMTVI